MIATTRTAGVALVVATAAPSDGASAVPTLPAVAVAGLVGAQAVVVVAAGLVGVVEGLVGVVAGLVGTG